MQETSRSERFRPPSRRTELATLELLLKNLPLVVICKDVKDDFRFTVWNKKAEEIFGLRASQVLGRTDYDLFPKANADAFRRDDLAAIQRGGILDLPEEIAVTPKGDLWLHTRKIPIFDEAGNAETLVLIIDEISEQRRQAEVAAEAHAAKKAADELSLLAEAIPHKVWTMDAKGLVQYCNQSWKSSFKVSEDCTQIEDTKVHPEDREIFRRAIKSMGDRKSIFQFEFRVRTGDTEAYHWQLAQSTPILDEHGAVVRWFSTCTDIQAQKDAERERTVLMARESAALEAARLKGEFLANMSHEIRTPLNGMIGMAQVLLESRLDESQRECVTTWLESSQLLLDILNDVLDFSRIEAGKLPLIPSKVSPRILFKELLELHRFKAREKELSIEFSVAPEVPEFFVTDALRLRQILFNLIGNALKFTNRGGVFVSLSLEGEGALRFRVRDTGIGIAPNVRAQLFESFSQGDASIVRRFGGTGLGLVISKNLTEMLGGCIGLESEVGKGTEFWFDLPLQGFQVPTESRRGERATLTPRAETASHAQTPMEVLVVEDNEINRKVLVKFLSSPGYHVHQAENGYEAVELCREHGFDLVLMDCQMPYMDGFEATRLIREREKNGGLHTPILAITAHAMAEDQERCLKAGMDGYVMKPILRHILLDAVERWRPKKNG